MDFGHAKDICKLGQSESCCRYLMIGGKDFQCAKLTLHKDSINKKVENGELNAQGDNCDGIEND